MVQTTKFLVVKLLNSQLSSLFNTNIRLRVLYSSLIVRDHPSHPYSTTGNIIVLYILIFKFLERILGDETVCTE